MSTFLPFRSRGGLARYFAAIGLLVLATAACSANVESENASPVTSAEIPPIEEDQPPAPPTASQVRSANIEPTREDESGETGTSTLPRRLHVGGQARMLDAMRHRSTSVDEADIAKTITIDIRRDEEHRYYFDPLEPLEVPAGETVKFIIRNIHVDSSDCW